MSKRDRAAKKVAKYGSKAVPYGKDDDGIIRPDIFLNYKIDQKFHLNEKCVHLVIIINSYEIILFLRLKI
jgi:hypothetical protein